MAGTTSASHRSTLAEMNNNLPAHQNTHDVKGKGKVPLHQIKAEVPQLRMVSTSALEDRERAGRREQRKDRRSISGPVSTTNQRRERGVRHSDIGSKPKVIEAIQEESEQSENVAGPPSGRQGQPSSAPLLSEPQEERYKEEPSIDLTWALRPSALRAQLPTMPIEKEITDKEKIAELRREIGNLQLDMLRMGRTFRVSEFCLTLSFPGPVLIAIPRTKFGRLYSHLGKRYVGTGKSLKNKGKRLRGYEQDVDCIYDSQYRLHSDELRI